MDATANFEVKIANSDLLVQLPAAPAPASATVPSPTSSQPSYTRPASASATTAVREVNLVHNEKIRVLLKSNDQLKRKIEELKAESKDNNRVKMIKALKLQVKELQAVCETLKSGMMKHGAGIAEIDDMLESALNQPRRVRPVRPETLQRQIVQLKDENHRLHRRAAATTAATTTPATTSTTSATSANKRPASAKGSSTASNSSNSGSSRTATSSAVTLQQQLEVARAELDAQKNIVAAHQQLLVETQAQLRLLRSGESKTKRIEEDNAELKSEVKRLKDKLLTSVSNDEQLYQEVRLLRGQLVAVEMAKSHTEEVRDAHSSKAERELRRYRERETQLLAQLAMLRTEVQAARDVTEWHKSRAEKARRALGSPIVTEESDTIAELREQLARTEQQLEQRTKEVEVLLLSPPTAASTIVGDATGGDTNQATEAALKEARDATMELHAGLDIAQRSVAEKDDTIRLLTQQIDDLQQSIRTKDDIITKLNAEKNKD